jgi:hypothetical protein
MSEPLPLQRQRTLLRDLAGLLDDRAAAEPAVDTDYKTRMEAAEREFQETRQRVVLRYAAEKEAAEREYAEATTRITEQFDREHRTTQREISGTRRALSRSFSSGRKALKSEFQEARWTLNAVCEAAKERAAEEWREHQEQAAAHKRALQTVQVAAIKAVSEWRQGADPAQEMAAARADPNVANKLRTVPACVTLAEEYLADLTDDVIRSYVTWRWIIWLVGLGLVLLLSGLGFIFEFEWFYGPAAGLVAAVAWVVGGSVWLTMTTRARVLQTYRPLCQILAHAAALCARYLVHYEKSYRRKVARCTRRHNKEVREALRKHRTGRAALKRERDTGWKQAEDKLRDHWLFIRKRRETDERASQEKYERLQKESQERYDTDLQQAHNTYFRKRQETEQLKQTEWADLAERWRTGMERTASGVREFNQESRRLFPSWDDPSWTNWAPPDTVAPVIRFGEYQVELAQVAHGLPKDDRLRSVGLRGFTLPACLVFPDRCSMLFKASDEGRTAAVESIQTVMLRLLTSLPPGKVRFTIIDPIGLGQNFAAFMHLADYDEALVASRIWTESQHIEQRLADLTLHMENVIQKYLRNQFDSIEEYNAHAGEVAEPFRVLVVANFPANFTTEAVRRLVSIVASGPRCGVHTLITVDSRQPMPQGFNLADLEQPSVNLAWKDRRFVWEDEDFGKFPLRLDAPPSAEFTTRLMHRVGERAKEANRVEVPFAFIAPPAEQWWQSDSRLGIHVALGRAGATKRQFLHLGHGTNQHVLIAGKTGSGKSTLLHALITNLALNYSPDEVELYLVDFKKGVEFKTYATHELPHARVVAVESEREFGLSVLQRLDAELRQRGDRFREVGSQNLAAYREANGKTATPRILLIVDEFQEFFVEDDKIAQEAAQLLDRLVRQGRAFGLHVLLGSQTLGGAYTLARSTIDQMAVRIALQCSEADGHIILSDDNSAARLLSRPGEAIYNDANGLIEGNNPFQVVWLGENDRESYLERVHFLDRDAARRPQIVFEGNAPAEPGKNLLLAELLHTTAWPTGLRYSYAWLGEAMAIKDPTSAVFRAQTGNNLLVVGQHDAPALGILATAAISLAAQHRPGDADNPAGGTRFYVLDGTPHDSAHPGFWGQLANVLPQSVRIADWRNMGGLVDELAEEVERRQKAQDAGSQALFLIVYGLQRFRDLRRSEDEFGFSRRGEEKPNPAKQFTTILREGPALGIHTLVWCDSLNNVTRSLDRQGMREFEMRVLFQMSATDSSVLIDSPQAAKLGLHRALFHSEDQGRLEKFRPYGVPSEAWLAEVRRWLREGRTVGGGVAAALFQRT